MVSLYINANLFSGKCRLGTMGEMVQWIGQPDDQLLNTGLYTLNYFYRKKDTWKLKLECTCSTGNNSLSSFSSYETVPAHEPLKSMSLRQFTCLKDIVMTHSQVALYEDTQAFISFLVQILQVDPQKRISPSEALMHPFITMEHFPSDLINDSPNQIKASACTPTRRTATGRENRPERHFLLASLEDALGRTSIISESLAFFGDNTDEDTTGSKFKAKKWFFRKINRFVSWLFKKAPFTNRFVDSSVQEETFACNNGKQLSTAILDKVVTICTNEEPTAAFDRTTEKSTSKASTAILDGPVTICANAEPTTAGSADNRPTAISDDAVTNDGLIAAADKAPVASDNTHSDEEPSTSAPTTFLNEPVTIHINNGSSVTTDKTTAILDTNDGPTDAADRTAAGSVSRPRNRNPSPSVIHCGLTSLVDRISDGNNKRPSDEKPSPTAVFNTNDGLTAAAERTTDANNRPSNKNGSMMDPLLQLSKLTPTAICCVPTAAVDRSTFTNNNRPNDEEPSQTTAASDRTSAGSDKRPSDVNPSPAAIIDGASMICTNNRRTATADSVTSPGDENPSPKALTDAASRTCAGSDNRPSNERPLPTVNLDEACDNSPQGRVNSVETSFASVGHGSKEVEGSTAGSKIKLNKQFLKRIHRYFIGLLKKGPFTYCLNVSDNKESSATSNENRSPTAITHETCDNRACGKTS
ncbi:hypothetical protein JOB18_008394 [Solea senegalensis]|uniref:Protein kinase domain-containing protein n=1 Tax=Solea senegalensis TaxID=28829 RepID=A0AAV6PT77_SOLSE|nr:hypothetical protein JOB18_008394 [Solea senegalensis]